MTEPSTVTVDLEGTAGQAATPDMLVKDEVVTVPTADRDIAFVDGRCQDVAVAPSDCVEPFDGVVGKTDHLVHDPVGHRRQDRLEVPVVFGAELPIHEAIEVLLLHHRTHHRPAR